MITRLVRLAVLGQIGRTRPGPQADPVLLRIVGYTPKPGMTGLPDTPLTATE